MRARAREQAASGPAFSRIQSSSWTWRTRTLQRVSRARRVTARKDLLGATMQSTSPTNKLSQAGLWIWGLSLKSVLRRMPAPLTIELQVLPVLTT